MTSTIGLYLIVKNEAEHLPRLLDNVKGCFDQIVLVDTGSTDDTKLIFWDWIHAHSHGGMFASTHDFTWVDDFGAARQYALDKLDTDWCVWMDADDRADRLDLMRPVLNAVDNAPDDVTGVLMPYAWTPTFTGMLLRATRRGKSRWEGRLHETQVLDGATARSDTIDFYTTRPSGHRSLEHDAAVLRMECREDPSRTRPVFYLAQTYKDMGLRNSALESYDQRVRMGGWAEEVFYSMHMGACLAADLDQPKWPERFIAAIEFRPSRPEPYYELARRYRLLGYNRSALMYAYAGLNLTPSTDILFVHRVVEHWGLMFEASIAAFYCGDPRTTREMSEKLLARYDLPEAHREAVKLNLEHALAALAS